MDIVRIVKKLLASSRSLRAIATCLAWGRAGGFAAPRRTFAGYHDPMAAHAAPPMAAIACRECRTTHAFISAPIDLFSDLCYTLRDPQ